MDAIQKAPHSIEAERQLLGGLLANGRQIEDVEHIAKPEDFFDPRNEAVYLAMSSLRGRHEPIDLVATWNEMQHLGLADRLRLSGEAAYLAELSMEATGESGTVSCARIVRDKSILRRVILESQRISAMAYRDDRPALEIVDEAQASIMGLSDLTPRKEPKSYRRVLHAALTGIEQRARMRCALTGVPSGIEEFDEITGGLQPGNLIIVAGRPGMGKTAWVQSFASHAIEKGHPGLMFSLEMTDDELGQRAMSAEAGIDGATLRSGLFRDIEVIKLKNAVARIKDYPLWVDDEGRQDLLSISATARRWRKNKQTPDKLGFVIVDYIQLLQGTGRQHNQPEERKIAEITFGLKLLAKELRLPVIALAALNRDCEKRADKRPQLSDLKGSGSIEADANIVVLLYRDEVYFANSKEAGVAEIIIAKNRAGQTGTVRAAYIKEQTRFAELSRRSS